MILHASACDETRAHAHMRTRAQTRRRAHVRARDVDAALRKGSLISFDGFRLFLKSPYTHKHKPTLGRGIGHAMRAAVLDSKVNLLWVSK